MWFKKMMMTKKIYLYYIFLCQIEILLLNMLKITDFLVNFVQTSRFISKFIFGIQVFWQFNIFLLSTKIYISSKYFKG